MADRSVLYIVHNHPTVRPGGSEVYALQLYEALRERPDWEALLLARTGPPVSRFDRQHLGTHVGGVNDDPNQYFFYTDPNDYDWVFSSLRTKEPYTRSLRQFLLAHRPDVVHFQHTLLLGFEALRETRNTLPDAAIVYTLHEFVPICHNHGQMIRTFGNELCSEASPRRCHECFPDISPQTFFLRKQFIRANLDLVDLFVAPSRFLLERYVSWGIPRDKIVCEENGSRESQRLPGPVVTARGTARPRNRIGFFGQLTPFKGADVLLRALKLITEDGTDAHLWLHGSNLELQPSSYRVELESLLDDLGDSVTLAGSYVPEDLPALMANVDWVVVPSIWWENSPLVIQEAFLHGRPVLCSDIGGMAEKVTHEVNGLHFRTGDPVSLAATLRRVVAEKGLWQRLSDGAPAQHRMSEHVDTMIDVYEDALAAVREGLLAK